MWFRWIIRLKMSCFIVGESTNVIQYQMEMVGHLFSITPNKFSTCSSPPPCTFFTSPLTSCLMFEEIYSTFLIMKKKKTMYIFCIERLFCNRSSFLVFFFHLSANAVSRLSNVSRETFLYWCIISLSPSCLFPERQKPSWSLLCHDSRLR